MCSEEVGAGIRGSRSQRKREPIGKCCTTGNLERTSALYIFIMPCIYEIVVNLRLCLDILIRNSN